MIEAVLHSIPSAVFVLAAVAPQTNFHIPTKFQDVLQMTTTVVLSTTKNRF